MKFNFSRLKQKLSSQEFDHLISEFSNQSDMKDNIIKKVKKEGKVITSLETSAIRIGSSVEDIGFTSLIFERYNDEEIIVDVE